MDFYKAVGAFTAGVVGGAVEIAKAVAETTVDIGKGIVEGVEDAVAGAENANTDDEKLDAIVDVFTKPLAGGISAGCKGIVKAPVKMINGVKQGVDSVLD